MDILVYIATSALVVNLAYWLYLFLGFPKDVRLDKHNAYPSVSIVIAALNEERNLSELIPILLDLEYPDFEIIVVDDGSDDDSVSFLSSIGDKRLKFSSIQNSRPGKRDALQHAAQLAQGEYIFLTDADCRPNGRDWLSKSMTHKNDAVIGLLYAPIFKRKGWLNALVRYETMVTALQYLTFAVKAKPYMGVGRNLIYKSSVYRKGIENIVFKTAGGDDDLTLQQMVAGNKIACITDPATWMYSEGPATFVEWFSQKARHVSTSYSYPLSTKAILGIFGATQIIWPAAVLLLLAKNIVLGVGLYIVRLFVLVIFGRTTWVQLDGKDELPLIPVLDFLLSVYFLIVLFLSFIRNKKTW